MQSNPINMRILKSAGGKSLKGNILCDVYFIKVEFGKIKQVHYFPSHLNLSQTEVEDILRPYLEDLKGTPLNYKTKSINHF